VIVINTAMARRYWPNERAVGHAIYYDSPLQIGPLGRTIVKPTHFDVVGIISDFKNTSLQASAEPAMFFSVRQFSYRNMNVVARGRAPIGTIDAAVRAAVKKMDPDLPLSGMKPLEGVLTAAVDPPRVLMALLMAFAALALLLAGLGLYGILGYTVSQRNRELSVRLALGAAPGQLRSMVVGDGLRLVVVGCVAGVSAAAFAGRALTALLYGVSPFDGRTVAAVVALLLIVGVIASALPARRAAAIDPIVGLRSE
jgi:putative ABC transport system permease protein